VGKVSYGKCERCEALGQIERVGTIDLKSSSPVVLMLCSQCSKLFFKLNRAERRNLLRKKKPAKHKPDNWTLQQIRAKANEKKKSPILLPTDKPAEPEKPVEKRSKGGLILP
jgi:hypothetical protein